MAQRSHLARMAAHLLAPHWTGARAFPARVMTAIESAIRASEATHRGELRFVVEGGLDFMPLWHRMTARARAVELFSALRVWDTEENSGVLIYVQLIDRKVEILADRGITRCVAQADWDSICHDMERAFAARRFEDGALAAIARIGALLARHFPARADNPNELPDRPLVL